MTPTTSSVTTEPLDEMGSEVSPDAGDLPPAVWRTVGSHFGDLLDLLRGMEPFASFEAGHWAVVVALVNSWRRTGVSPAPSEVAAASGWSLRSVFRQVILLEDNGIVRPLGRPFGGSYGVGHALAPILRAFASDRAAALWRFDAAGPAASGVSVRGCGAYDALQADGSDRPVAGASRASATVAVGRPHDDGSRAADAGLSATVALTRADDGSSRAADARLGATVAVRGADDDGSQALDAGVSATVAVRTADDDGSRAVDAGPSATVAVRRADGDGSRAADTSLSATVAVRRPVDHVRMVSRIPDGPMSLRAALSPVLEQLRGVTPPQPAPSPLGSPAECHPGTEPPSATSLNKNKKLRSSSSSEGEPPLLPERGSPPTTLGRPATESDALDAKVSRRIACAALAALHRQTHPQVPLPRTFDASDVALVERCGANGTWDVATLEQMHLDAIKGAVRTSSGPPRPFYIWGRFTHFLEHARRGRASRAEAAPRPPPKKREPEEPAASPEWVANHIRAALQTLGRPPQ